MREEHRQMLIEGLKRSAAAGLGVLESLYRAPIISVKDVSTSTGTTYAAANTIVSRLVELGILREITGNSRNRRFQYWPYVQLFTRDQ
jgi:Fic family protein